MEALLIILGATLTISGQFLVEKIRYDRDTKRHNIAKINELYEKVISLKKPLLKHDTNKNEFIKMIYLCRDENEKLLKYFKQSIIYKKNDYTNKIFEVFDMLSDYREIASFINSNNYEKLIEEENLKKITEYIRGYVSNRNLIEKYLLELK